MRIIIGGAGEVGRGVARALYDEGQDVVLIDSDPAAIKEAQSKQLRQESLEEKDMS